MACLQPNLRIRIGTKRHELIKTFKGFDVVRADEEGIVKERSLIVCDLPSNRKKLEESNTSYDLIPCGVCDECYKKRVKEWAIRIINETKYHSENYFITMTYDDSHLPFNRSVDKKGVIKFFKRLKDYYRNEVDKNIKFKYYCVAEYGEGKGTRAFVNPHYHFIGFGLPLINFGLTSVFPDGKEHFSQSGDKLFYSPLLSKLWCDDKTRESLGFVTVQEVTFGSASYVAGYVHKKLIEQKPIIHQEVSFFRAPDGRALAMIVPVRYNPYEYLNIEKPFSLMSKGIGEQYILEHMNKIYLTDEVFYNSGEFGVKSSKPPRYYDKKLMQHNEKKAKEIKSIRKFIATSTIAIDNDREYLYNKDVKIDLSKSKSSLRKRGLTTLT